MQIALWFICHSFCEAQLPPAAAPQGHPSILVPPLASVHSEYHQILWPSVVVQYQSVIWCLFCQADTVPTLYPLLLSRCFRVMEEPW